jgi:membrane dipeptidase
MSGLDLLDRRLAEARGRFLLVRGVADIRRARRECKCGIIYGFEGARPLAGDLGNLRKFYDRGLRELQLFWAVPSPLKQPDGSLTDFGGSVVREANQLGILLDLSHMNDAAFRQVMETSTRPVIVSHCGVAAVSGRKGGGTDQLNDETIRRIAGAGGVIGLHFYEGYITARHGEHSTVTDLVDHIDYIKRLVGIDCVALGADYFPESGWRWIEGAERMAGIPNVAREMVRRGYSDVEIEQVLGGNLIRLYGKVWKP